MIPFIWLVILYHSICHLYKTTDKQNDRVYEGSSTIDKDGLSLETNRDISQTYEDNNRLNNVLYTAMNTIIDIEPENLEYSVVPNPHSSNSTIPSEPWMPSNIPYIPQTFNERTNETDACNEINDKCKEYDFPLPPKKRYLKNYLDMNKPESIVTTSGKDSPTSSDVSFMLYNTRDETIPPKNKKTEHLDLTGKSVDNSSERVTKVNKKSSIKRRNIEEKNCHKKYSKKRKFDKKDCNEEDLKESLKKNYGNTTVLSNCSNSIYNFAIKLMKDPDVKKKIYKKNHSVILLKKFNKLNEKKYKPPNPSISSKQTHTHFIVMLEKQKKKLLTADQCNCAYELLDCVEFNEVLICMATFHLSNIYYKKKSYLKDVYNDKYSLMKSFQPLTESTEMSEKLDFLKFHFYRKVSELPIDKCIIEISKLIYFFPDQMEVEELMTYQSFLKILHADQLLIVTKTFQFIDTTLKLFYKRFEKANLEVVINLSEALKKNLLDVQTKLTDTMNTLAMSIKEKLPNPRLFSLFLYLQVSGYIFARFIHILKGIEEAYRIGKAMLTIMNACERILGENIFANSSISVSNDERNTVNQNQDIFYIILLYVKHNILKNCIKIFLNDVGRIIDAINILKTTDQYNISFKDNGHIKSLLVKLRLRVSSLAQVFRLLNIKKSDISIFMLVKEKRLEISSLMKKLKYLRNTNTKHKMKSNEKKSINEVFNIVFEKVHSIHDALNHF